MKRLHIIAFVLWSAQLGLFLAACRSQNAALPDGAPPTPEPTLTVAPPPAITVAAVSTPTSIPSATATPLPVSTATATIEATRPPLGTAERPIRLLFPPVTSGAVIAQRAEPLAEALRAATGLEFAVGIADNESALVELLCSAPEDVIGFLSAAAYTIAHDECDAQPGLVAVRDDGLTWQMGMLAIRPGEVEDLAGLAGKRWAAADTHSLPNYLYFLAQMTAAGIEPGELIAVPEETTALLSVYDNTADFTTASYVPPIMPAGREWIVGESSPEEWRLLGIPPSRSPIGYVIVAGEPEFGGYRIRDARARLFDTTPDIFDVTRVLALSEPIPNDTIVLGADFPPSVAQQTLATLTEFAASEACTMSLCSADLFGWAGLEPVDDSAYDPIRTIKNTLELDTADLWAELD